jgi:hypothetical protein
LSQVIGYFILALVGLGLVGVIFRPHWAFVLAVLLYPLKQVIGGYLPIFMKVSPLFNFIVFAAVVLAVLARLARRERPTSGAYNALAVVTFALYAWATLAILWTPGNGMARWIDGYPYWIMNVMLLPLALMTVEDFRKTLVPLLVAGTVTALLFYINPNTSWYAGRLTIYMAGRGTMSEIRGNPLAVGQMGGMVAIAAALMLPVRAGMLMNILRIAAMLAGLGLALTSGSRAQAVFAVGTIVLFYPVSRRMKNSRQFLITAGGLMMVMGMIYLALALFLGRTEEQSKRWDVMSWGETIVERVDVALQIVYVYLDSPQNWIQGLGTNAFSALAGNADPKAMDYAHNAPVEMLSELGLVGFSLYILACVLALRICLRFFRANAEEPARRATVAVLLAVSFFSFGLSLKQYTFVAMPEPWWLWILIAKLWTHENRLAMAYARQEEHHSPEWEGPAADDGTDAELDEGMTGERCPA